MGNDSLLQIIIRARDEATKVIKGVDKSVGGMTTSFGTAVKASTAVAAGMGIAGAAAGAFGFIAIKAAGNMQSLRMGLDAVSGSSEESEKQLVRLREVAKLPGLGFSEAIRGSVNLQAAGLSANTAERALKSFGNALATVGKGKAELDGVILALTQIASKGKVSAEEINQLNERIPQIRVAMKNAFGTADTEALTKLGIDSQTFINGIIKEFEKLPPVMGGFNNSIENLQDSWNVFLSNEGAKVLVWATKFIDSVNFMVTDVLPKLIVTLETVGKFFAEHQTLIYIVAGAIVGALVPSLMALAGAIWTVVIPAIAGAVVALAPFIIGGAIVGGIVAGIVWMIKHWDLVKQKISEVVSVFQVLIDIYNKVIALATKPIKFTVNAVGSAVSKFTSAVGSLVPHLASGGIVTSPTMALIGEAGPEAVVPLSGNRGGIGSNITVNINNPQVRSRGDVDYMREQIEAALRDIVRVHKLATI